MNPQADKPPTKRLGRRASIIGALVAVLLLAALGGLSWYLTRPAAPGAAAGGGGPGGPGGGGPGGPGGFGGGRGGASTVGVATAEKASVPVVIDALGTVTPQATVKVRPQVSGVLEKVLFKEGQMVKAGELMAVIDARQFELALMQASGQRQRDEAQLDSAKVTLQRFKTLLEQDSIARQEVDTQTALVKQLEGTVAVDKANEGVARLNLSYTRVLAPISGRVGLRTVDVGNVVNPSDVNGVALITQLSPIDVVFAVPQDRVGDLQKTSGADAIKVTAMDRTRVAVLEAGSFASLDNQIDTTTGTVKAKARFANAQGALFPNQFVNIQVLVKTTDNAVVVPVAALRQGSAGDYVYVLNADRTVSLRLVTRGQATVEKVVVAAGLQAGERVITEGADRLKDGSRVSLAGDAPRGPRGGASGAGGAGGVGGKFQRPDGVSGAAAPAAAASGATPPDAATAPQGRKPASAEGKAANAAAPQAAVDLPTPEQRQRMLDRAKDDPEQLAQRKRFLEQLDKRDPEAMERWRAIRARQQSGGGERPAQ
jgi:multidrug efflux system membrane fusion protein